MKIRRQQLILDIIADNPMATQEQLVQELFQRGLRVSQATISRDIKELGLVKIPLGANRYSYALPPDQTVINTYGRLQRLVKDSVTKIDDSENIIMIRTLPGAANAVASCLDNLAWPEIIGTVAGDDTILMVIKSKRMVTKVLTRLRELKKKDE